MHAPTTDLGAQKRLSKICIANRAERAQNVILNAERAQAVYVPTAEKALDIKLCVQRGRRM